jgi:hypothetical protein
MTPSGLEVPPPRVLQLMLRKITETLARELVEPSESAPDWSEFEWIAARAVAAMHGISPLLSKSLLWNGPPGWLRFLREQRLHTENRYRRLDALLRRIDAEAAEAEIPVLPLKGVALHALGIYQCGERPMADIDLLVRPIDAERIVKVLESFGFRQTSEGFKERVFTPLHERAPDNLGEHSSNDLKIELHERICERLPWSITDRTADIFPEYPRAGFNAYPSKAALMLHLLLHAAGSMPAKALRLLQLHDIALLSSQMTAADWKLILANRTAERKLWWAFPPLKLASRYYSTWIPDDVLTALANECPMFLRTVASRRSLYDVSYSYLWVDAFPGIEWSQSVPKAIEYAANRLRPSANMLVLREQLAKSEAWMHQDEWSQLTQGRRVLRWLSSRPTRPVTMHAVVAALDQAP